MTEVASLSRMCPKCDAAADIDARFCSQCGASISEQLRESTLETARKFAVGAATEAGHQARDVLKSESAQRVAGGAALGAVTAAMIPFVTIGVGAAIGAGIIAYRRLLK